MGKNGVVMPEGDVPDTEGDSAFALRWFGVGVFPYSEEIEEGNDAQVTSCSLLFLACYGPQSLEVMKH